MRLPRYVPLLRDAEAEFRESSEVRHVVRADFGARSNRDRRNDTIRE